MTVGKGEIGFQAMPDGGYVAPIVKGFRRKESPVVDGPIVFVDEGVDLRRSGIGDRGEAELYSWVGINVGGHAEIPIEGVAARAQEFFVVYHFRLIRRAMINRD